MKDKYTLIMSLEEFLLRIEILRRFFDLDKDYAIIHEIMIVSDNFLKESCHGL